MKLSSILSLFSLLLASVECSAELSLLGSTQPQHVIIHNRILAKVNGKAISVIDLMKKMDILFYREFPEYTSFPEARYQFYLANWKSMLQELVNKELILADAEENKLPVTSGEVRQEMEHMFGPNIIANLDKIGMTFEEAWKIVQGDILLHRMLFIRVNSKALREVTPRDVFAYYEQYAKENMRLDQWNYRVISIRDKDSAGGAATANLAHQLLTREEVALSDLASKLKEHSSPNKSQVNISELYSHGEKEISPNNKDILQKMSPKTYSNPIAQKSKDNSMVFRFFYLEEMRAGGPPPFKEVESKLKEKLLEKEVEEKAQAYMKKLRQHFDVQEMIPLEFEPFSLSH